MSAAVMSPRVNVARILAGSLLEELGDRWLHTCAVAARAEELAVTVAPTDRETLLIAAWLHDIGYAPPLAVKGFHPLDGATYLDRHGWPNRIAALVAHHSGADFLAAHRGLQSELDLFTHEISPVADAVTYADQTTGPAGQRLTIHERLRDMLQRHGPDSTQAHVHHLRAPHLLAVADRVEQRIGERPPAAPRHQIPDARPK